MKIKSIMIITASFVILFFVTGCATILNGGDQEVTVNSSPSAAEVIIKSNEGVIAFAGKSPVTTELSRKNEYEVIVKMEGYKEATVRILKNFNIIYLGNIICGGLVGLIIDPITGAMWKLEPDEINVTLAVALNNENNEKEMYVTFRYMDDQNRLRTVYVPLIKA